MPPAPHALYSPHRPTPNLEVRMTATRPPLQAMIVEDNTTLPDARRRLPA